MFVAVLILHALQAAQLPEAPEAFDQAVEAPTPALADLDRWRARIRPSADEVAWEAIPWVASFADGLRQADRDGRPLLFWAMNGHPLGCT